MLRDLSDPLAREGRRVACATFALLLEGSLHSKRLWQHMKEHPGFHEMLRALALNSSAPSARESFVRCIKAHLAAPSTLVNPKSLSEPNYSHQVCRANGVSIEEFVSILWAHLVQMIPRRMEDCVDTEHLISIAMDLFRSMDKEALQELPLAVYLDNWSTSLLSFGSPQVTILSYFDHKAYSNPCQGLVNESNADCTIAGLSKLISLCMQQTKGHDKPLKPQ